MKLIESSDITERLVGITANYLNIFIQRELYGIKPSVQKGKLRQQRRLFSEEDVFGIALAWMLFESGLRTQAIRRVMKEVAGTKAANAKAAAKVLLESEAEYIVVEREARKPKGKTEPEPKISTASHMDLREIVSRNRTANVLLVPIGAKFETIKKLLEMLY
jgi:hypothetical protein